MQAPSLPLIGLYEKALPSDLSLNTKIEQIKRAGFDFFELSIDESSEFIQRLEWGAATRRELRQAARDSELPILSLCLSGQRRYPLGSADPDIRRKSKEILKQSIQLASDLDTRIVLISGYWVYHEAVNPQSEAYFIEGMQYGARLAARYGVMMGIENIDSNTQINSIRKVMQVVQAVNSPWLKIYADFANLAAFDLDMVDELQAGQGNIVAVHVKDAIRNEVRGIPLGQGIVDFSAAFDQFAAMQYSGPFLLEMWSQPGQDAYASACEALQNTQDLLKASAYYR
ncbi:MAG: L-ribulose-5-phosphate 3-epimerase [Chloroflexota bacterium]|nr:L-ribulose-5-phosphate 3-epimerase [Chloroflexota bacterium]